MQLETNDIRQRKQKNIHNENFDVKKCLLSSKCSLGNNPFKAQTQQVGNFQQNIRSRENFAA